MTLTRYILVEQKRHPEATGDLTIILNSIQASRCARRFRACPVRVFSQTACKAITAAVRRAGLANLYGLQGGAANATGDDVSAVSRHERLGLYR
jgi:fructose-1,6-bisphosphatase I